MVHSIASDTGRQSVLVMTCEGGEEKNHEGCTLEGGHAEDTSPNLRSIAKLYRQGTLTLYHECT